MLVSEALSLIRNNLLEDPIDGPFTNEVLISYLNEGIKHVQSKVVNEDPGGSWFAVEAEITYPANTRWYTPPARGQAGSLGGYISRVYTCRRVGQGRPDAVASTDPRLELEFYSNRHTLALMLRGKSLGLRVVGTENSPPTPTTLRITYLPHFQPITTANLALVIGDDIPIPIGFEEAVVAYVVVLCQMAQETPSSQFESRYAQIESALLDNIRRSRQTQNTPPMVRISDPYEYE